MSEEVAKKESIIHEEGPFMDTEVEIDLSSGDVILNRDHEFMVELARLLGVEEDISNFEEFFQEKPCDINGNKDYNSFCG